MQNEPQFILYRAHWTNVNNQAYTHNVKDSTLDEYYTEHVIMNSWYCFEDNEYRSRTNILQMVRPQSEVHI